MTWIDQQKRTRQETVTWNMSPNPKNPDLSQDTLHNIMEATPKGVLPRRQVEEGYIEDPEEGGYRPSKAQSLEDPYVSSSEMKEDAGIPSAAHNNNLLIPEEQIKAMVNGGEDPFLDERYAEEGQAEGYEGSDAELIKAAEGGYRPASDTERGRYGEAQEAYDTVDKYSEADSQQPFDQ